MTTMAKTNHSLAAIFCLFLMLPIYCFNFGESSITESVKTWCVAKPSANDNELKNNIRFACEHTVPTDCDAINQGGPCYNPNNLFHHASFAMNSYYQEAGRHQWNCDFLNSALVAISDPSLGSCVYKGEPTSVDLSASVVLFRAAVLFRMKFVKLFRVTTLKLSGLGSSD
ncbi:major pollen allergen Ole e 10-like [Ziziphus jujuba]|uniref:Major pollen allergen Ole e 10-like n=1 Tax=Ziziphus jujuba TaxID=326968 RepID=A0ABM3ZZ50_ZIZJJ|nr:major pollen allergen Ole e 10-like [Ziziphus jujuba]